MPILEIKGARLPSLAQSDAPTLALDDESKRKLLDRKLAKTYTVCVQSPVDWPAPTTAMRDPADVEQVDVATDAQQLAACQQVKDLVAAPHWHRAPAQLRLQQAAQAERATAAQQFVQSCCLLREALPREDRELDVEGWQAAGRKLRQSLERAPALLSLLWSRGMVQALGGPEMPLTAGLALAIEVGYAERIVHAEIFSPHHTADSDDINSIGVGSLLLTWGRVDAAALYFAAGAQQTGHCPYHPQFAPARGRYMLGQARVHFARQDPSAARRCLDVVGDVQPSHAALRLSAAEMLLEHGYKRQALAHLTAAYTAAPDDARVMQRLAATYLQVNLLHLARQTAARLLQADPLDPLNYLLSAQISLAAWGADDGDARANMQEAIKHFTSAVALVDQTVDEQPSGASMSWQARCGLATAQRQLIALQGADFDRGLVHQTMATFEALETLQVEHLAALADCHTLLSDHAQAAAVLRRGLAEHPGQRALTLQLSSSLCQNGKCHEALPLLAGLHRADKDAPDIAFLYGVAAEQAGDLATAERMLRLAMARASHADRNFRAEVAGALTSVLIAQDALQEANETCAVAVDLQPKSSAFKTLQGHLKDELQMAHKQRLGRLEIDVKQEHSALDAQKEKVRCLAADYRNDMALQNARRLQQVTLQTEQFRAKMRTDTAMRQGKTRTAFALLDFFGGALGGAASGGVGALTF